jgi:xylan 1,4-beta-xylosidase
VAIFFGAIAAEDCKNIATVFRPWSAPMRGFFRRPSPTVEPTSGTMARRAFSARALGAGASALLPGRLQSATPDQVSAFVDFSSRIAVRSMNGFLNSIHHSNPPSERIRPLQPKLWRSNELRLHGAIHSWGAKFEGVPSDGWGYPLNGNWKSPYENVAAWEALVRRIAELTRGREIYWDIWNEPDMLGSWLGSREAFFATWISAARILKQTLGPDTKVGGPSTSSFQPAFFEAFLSSCLRAGCEVNFLCWHELEPWSDIALVERNVRYARREYAENARFQKLKLSEIHVNEYVGEVDQYRPAELLAFLFYLERGGADYAARSCWGAHCEDNSIDGIIDPRTLQPRAPWWVHAYYAAGCERRVRSDSDFGHVVVIGQALPAGANHVQALIGYYGHEGATAPRLPVEIRLSGLSRIVKSRRARIMVMRIPDVGARTLITLPVVFDELLDVVDDQVLFRVDSLAVHEVCAIRVEEI